MNIKIKMEQIAKITGGKIISGEKDLVIKGISIDSRKATPGNLFIALEGEKHDGHDYVKAAFQKGVTAALIEEKKREKFKEFSLPLIVVEDTYTALGSLARYHRQKFNIPIIAVTGSNGKTTTKDITAAVFSQRFKVLKSQGSYNNEIGLPLTLLQIDNSTEAVILEMAMRGKGQIRYLCKTAKPEAGIITNISGVHFELLGSMENIAEAKGELLEELPENGLAVLNWEDAWIRKISHKFSGKIMKFGFRPESDVRAENIEQKEFESHFDLCYGTLRERVSLPLPGEHNVLNALAAAAAALYYGLSLKEIGQGLKKVKISEKRLEIIPGPKGTTIINDSYNANPVSMIASLGILKTTGKGRKIAVLGDMLELGGLAVFGHREVGREIAAKKIDYLITVGSLAGEIAEGAKLSGFPQDKIFQCNKLQEAAGKLQILLEEGDTVLIKGSRAMKMERIIEELGLA